MSASLKQKIAEVFDEPGCDKNQGKSEKERKKGCTKQLTPGAAAGAEAAEAAEIGVAACDHAEARALIPAHHHPFIGIEGAGLHDGD